MSRLSSLPTSLKFGMISSWARASDYLSTFEKKKVVQYKKTPLKVCLVKTTACRELYNRISPCPTDQLIFSSTYRTGPIGLIQSLYGDMLIVNTVPDYESQVFIRREGGNPESYRLRVEKESLLSSFALDVETIEWGKYDLVVAFENSVPSRVAKEYPNVTFVSMLEDHRCIDYRRFRHNLPAGYKMFFNLRSGPSPHDFSYGFREASALEKLLPDIEKKEIILVENHEDPKTCDILENLTGMRAIKYSSDSAKGFYELIRSAKFFVSLKPSRPLGGLASIDAISSGTIVVANRYKAWNPHPICPDLQATDCISAAKIINRLNASSILYNDMLLKQNTLLQYYCYDRPLGQILKLLQ